MVNVACLVIDVFSHFQVLFYIGYYLLILPLLVFIWDYCCFIRCFVLFGLLAYFY